jgi:murein biosynthesis integral membrane protein MurJ
VDRASALVAIGIFCSRLTGFVRQRVFAHYFGLQSDAADAFMAAFRIPNFLQNLFGEGALSASFIPVYAALEARKEHRESTRVAGAVAALLSLVTSALVLAGVLLAPLLVALIAPGFRGEKRDLTVAIVRILFPGAGLLVLSAWCLGILNSHRRFLLSYLAPVIWNVSMIATLLWWGARVPLPSLAVILGWGAVAGSALQLLVQLPSVLTLVPNLRFRLELTEHVRATVRNFFPVFVSRGVVQISAYIDEVLASLLPTGAVTGLANAQLMSAPTLLTFSAIESTAGCGRSPSSWCPPPSPFSPSAMWFRRRCFRPAASDTKIRCTCGGFLRARRSVCSRQPWLGCTRRRITPCAIPARRFAMRSFMWPSQLFSATSPPLSCLRFSESNDAGALWG